MQLSFTLIIIIITCLVSLGAFSSPRMMNDLIFYPPAISRQNQWYRFFSCGLIHADFGHLLFNMLSLYLFGQFVESKFTEIFEERGRLLYLLMYVLALGVSLIPTYLRHRHDSDYRSLGASGAVSAVVFAGLLIAPYVEVGLFFIPPIIPGFIFAPLYLLVSVMMERRGADNINHSAHIWGALFGIAFITIAGRLLAHYDAIGEFVNGVKFYLHAKGWMS
ncbi:MAG TPA: rhomboid family intramembrane serine protease [Chitinophagaceae bacterium]|nr:rhomboid family intramembrane serine protease [Chitinophagaceae bacterium]